MEHLGEDFASREHIVRMTDREWNTLSELALHLARQSSIPPKPQERLDWSIVFNFLHGVVWPNEQEAKSTTPESLILNVTQAAKLLGVSRPTVYRLVKSGALPAKKLSTGSDTAPRPMILSEDLRSFLANLPPINA